MRILQLHTKYLEAGGEDGVVKQQANLLRSNSHQVSTLEYQNPTSRVRQLSSLATASWNPAAGLRARRSAEEFVPDVVHAHNTWYAASPAAMRELHRTAPTVMTLHNYRFVCLNSYLFRDGSVCTDCVGTVPWRGVVHRCYRSSSLASAGIAGATMTARLGHVWNRYVDQFLVLSDFAAEVVSSSGIDVGRISRMNNFVPDPGQRLHAPSQSRRVLAVGRLSPEKGFVELVETWKSNRPSGLTLTIVGDGTDYDQIKALDAPGVELLGRKSGAEVQGLMLDSRALLFPSLWYEGQPLVILEALAAGLPVISSDRPPLREVLEPAGQILVPDGEWRGALDALSDVRWLDQASGDARRSYLERFAPAVAYDRLLAVYSGMTG